MRRILSAAALLLGAGAAALAQSAAPFDAMYRGPDREQRLVEGAKKEGEVIAKIRTSRLPRRNIHGVQ